MPEHGTRLNPLKPELLAPAGTPDCFHAALEAGADAVYCGVDNGFNARLRAKNFSVKTLSHLIPFAHANNRKVYITVNTLIKQQELEPAVHLLYQLEQLGVDAIIVQDIGLIHICRTHFPRLRLHASTQMALHNSAGVAAAEAMGIKRAVLARELTVKEVAAIKRTCSAELEVFVHGALCYSFSGMCLASSFLGGSSGNRGRCTQVCRREFSMKNSASRGYFFSPGDLCLLNYLDRYREAGVSSYKIEGRMKSAGYVRSVVAMYRRAIDNPDCVPELLAQADNDMGRSKTTLFSGGVVQQGIIDHHRPPGTGIYVGCITSCTSNDIVVETDYCVVPGDWLRIQPASGFEGSMVRVVESTADGSSTRITCKDVPAGCGAGDTLYCTRRALAKIPSTLTHPGKVSPLIYRQTYAGASAFFLNYWRTPPLKQAKPADKRPAIMIGTPGWLDILEPSSFSRLLVAMDAAELKQVLLEKKLEHWQQRIALCPPPFIAEGDMPQWQALVRTAQDLGINNVVCRNAGHLRMFNPSVKLSGGDMLWCINRAAQKALGQFGISEFCYSPEDDYPNIRASASSQGTFCLFSHVPLFVSRMEPALLAGTVLKDAFKAEFFTERRAGLHWLISKKPVCYFNRRSKLEESGISSFYLDVSFCKPDKQFLQKLLMQYRTGVSREDGGSFNFKAGLK